MRSCNPLAVVNVIETVDAFPGVAPVLNCAAAAICRIDSPASKCDHSTSLILHIYILAAGTVSPQSR